MKTNRRDFIQDSILTAGGIFLYSSVFAAVPKQNCKFYPQIGVCTDLSKSDLLKGFGYSFLEESVQKFLIPAEPEEKFLANLEQARNSSLPIKALNSFLPSEIKITGPAADIPLILRLAKTAFERAQIAKIKVIVFGSGKARHIPEGFSRTEARKQFVELCGEMAVLAEKNRVTIVLEPLNTQECNFINSVTEGALIVKEVNHPNFRLLADIYHMKKEGESPDSIIEFGSLLRHVHLAEKEGRSAPGTFNEDFTDYFNALEKINYQGLISIECRWKDMTKQLPVAIQTIRHQL